MSINTCELSGRLTKDALVRGQGETKVAKFFIATESWNRAKQEKHTSFIPCTWFFKDGNGTLGLLRKGTFVVAEGSLRSSTFEAKDTGQRVYRLEVIVRKLDIPKTKPIQAPTEGQTETTPTVEKKRAGHKKTNRSSGEAVPF